MSTLDATRDDDGLITVVLTREQRHALRGAPGGDAMYDAGFDRHDGREESWDRLLRLIADFCLLDAIGWQDEDDDAGNLPIAVTPGMAGVIERLAAMSRDAIDGEIYNRQVDPDHHVPSDEWIDENLDVVSAYQLVGVARLEQLEARR